MQRRVAMHSLVLTLLLVLLVAGPAGAQEIRGNINGVVEDASGVVPGAMVRITNVETSQTQQLITSDRGYFEALLLNPGTYAVRVELAGFKTLTQTGISLAVGQTLSLTLKLEVGQLTEQIEVRGEAPLIDTTTVSSGQNFDRRLVEALPMFSNMPIMLSRFTPGVAPAEAEVQNIFQGYMEGTTAAAGGQVGTGSGFDNRNTGNLYTIDGSMNNGFGRRIASSPNADQIEEVRIETSNFDASQGHGTGLTVSMMTRSGTNALRGSGNYTHWNNELNSPNLQQKATFKTRPDQEEAWRAGRSHIAAFTLGGPMVIPRVLDGRGKVFFFANYSKSDDSAPGRLAGTSTVPANRKHLEGDFSDLLLLPSGAGANTPAGHHQYQIFDPLTTRPDPARSGSFIRDPFPGNIIPKDRFLNPDGSYKNPAFGLYQAMVPAPNQNFLSPTTQPVNNYYRAAEPDQPHNTQGSFRLDYNHSESDRFFVRVNGNRFLESSLVDWTYDSPDPQFQGLHDVARARFSWSATGTWTKVLSNTTLIDTQISGNRAHQRDTRKNLVNYSPTSVGLPVYMDEYCQARFECILPQQTIGPPPFGTYQGMGGVVDRGIWVTTYQGQSNITSTRGSHTWRGGVDIQWAQRTAQDGAGNMGTFVYDNTYTRAADTTNVFPAQQLGLSLAAFMLGMPTSVSIADESGFDVRNNYFGSFVQDTWRVGRNLTLNLGLRFEYENGIKEAKDRALLWFDPDAEVSIAAIAEAAYAARPDPALPASAFNVQGGTVYAGAEGYDDRSWKPEALWMPRLSFGYRLGERMAVKGGYGMYYDTLNARDWTPDLQGFNVTTTNQLSNDFGRTFALGDPRNGILPLVDPFPVRPSTGSRYENVLGNALGLDTMVGRQFSAENPDRKHARVQRWRMSWQREIASRTALEVAYSGSYADRQSITIRQDYLPEQYWNSSNFRDTSANAFLTANVPNPFNIANYASFQTTNPDLYQRMLGSTIFTATQIPRHRLLRAFPHMNAGGGLTYLDQPLGVIKAHTLEVVLTQRYAYGLTGHAAFSANRVTENRTVEEYDREPTLWQTNNNGRPWRVTGVGVYELPFGPGRAFLDNGGVVSHLARGWSVSGTYEYQPGALLNWGNIFFNGNLADIKKDKPEIAFQPDGTIDPTKTWFNTEAGFVKATGDQPAAFQKRVFPFRVEGVRGQSLSMINMSVARTFSLGRTRTFQFRADVQNLLNRQHYANPNLNPTSTEFGQVRAVNNTVMRFITFNTTLRF
jgi:hypothetical protein